MAQIPYFQGHRGFRGHFPENTLPAFQAALDLDVVLEMDVCISKDKQVVVSHEPYMNPLFCFKPDGQKVLPAEESSFNLYQMNYEEIKAFDTGINGNPRFPLQAHLSTHKPLLKEVLRFAEANRKGRAVYYNIEIKSDSSEYGISQPNIEEFCQLVLGQIAEQVDPQFVILQSFDFKVLRYVEKSMQAGKFKRMALSALVTRKSPANTVKDLGFVPSIYSSEFTSLDTQIVQEAHTLGMRVIPWTANTLKDIQHLKHLGVDGIITDFPNLKNEL